MKTGSLERRLGYRFNDPILLQQALTHRSYGTPNNERLEFLGDSVLGLVIAQELYARFGAHPEGKLSRLRAALVRAQTLAEVALEMELGEHLRLGEGELKSGGFRRPSILADALEALFGAVLLDGGVEAARGVILRLYQPLVEGLDPKQEAKDPKTQLQEYLQGRHSALPSYRVTSTTGIAPNEVFQVECVIADLGVSALGSGSTRRGAEQDAAQQAFERLSRT